MATPRRKWPLTKGKPEAMKVMSDGVEQAEPVAWRVKNNLGSWYYTENQQLVITWTDFEKLDVEPLYAHPATPLRAEVERLREALEPFGDIDGEGTEDFADDTPVIIHIGGRVTHYATKLIDFRRTRAALKGANPS